VTDPASPAPRSDFDRIGGAEGLHRIMSAFIERVSGDFILGFLFEGRDLPRIVRHEIELASQHLDGPFVYGGRPLGQVHRPLKINRGQFRRRLALLARVLEQHGVAADIIERWVDHDRRLEGAITGGLDCVPDEPGG
jgi:truncated hemoglobin YjbI